MVQEEERDKKERHSSSPLPLLPFLFLVSHPFPTMTNRPRLRHQAPARGGRRRRPAQRGTRKRERKKRAVFFPLFFFFFFFFSRFRAAEGAAVTFSSLASKPLATLLPTFQKKKKKMLETPLIRAAHNGHLAAVSALLAAGADPNAVDAGDNTPLHWAAMRGHVEIITKLLKAGGDPASANAQGRAPADLCQACWSPAWRFAREALAGRGRAAGGAAAAAAAARAK